MPLQFTFSSPINLWDWQGSVTTSLLLQKRKWRFRNSKWHAQRRLSWSAPSLCVQVLWLPTPHLPSHMSRHQTSLQCLVRRGGLSLAVEWVHEWMNASFAGGARPQVTLPTQLLETTRNAFSSRGSISEPRRGGGRGRSRSSFWAQYLTVCKACTLTALPEISKELCKEQGGTNEQEKRKKNFFFLLAKPMCVCSW